jgi:pimeloyl-ACP methyl ester carboxylesterase
MRVVYLHGFASGPGSRKARYFAERLSEAGVDMVAPDLAQGDFENLTISGQLEVLAKAVGTGPVALAGSSMGGFVAALYAARNPVAVSHLLLLAPAFGFAARWPAVVGAAAVERWLSTGKLPVYHYAEGRTRDLGLAMYHDSQRWESEPAVTQPCLIFHGVHDAVVPIEASREFVATHPNARLMEMDSDHELTDVLPQIWDDCREFLLRPPVAPAAPMN